MFPKKFLMIVMIILSSVYAVFSQSYKIKEYLKMVREGKITDVKLILPDLLAEFPNDPGVQFLHAAVLDDANKAVEIYERIIRNYPQSEYADECYWRIIQYFALKGEIERASREFDNYRKTFPNSAFLTPASDLIRTAIALARVNIRTKETEQSQNVSKEAASPDAEKIPIGKSEQSPRKGTFGLQVGLYSTIESAKSEVERFRAMRLRADIFTKKIDAGTTMYAVVIGDYPTREKAEAEKPIVQEKCGCTPIIYAK